MTTIAAMSIAPYLREIGRGKEGARALPRDKAFDLMSQLLDVLAQASRDRFSDAKSDDQWL